MKINTDKKLSCENVRTTHSPGPSECLKTNKKAK